MRLTTVWGIFVIVASVNGYSIDANDNLKTTIFQNYSKNSRPSAIVDVKVRYNLMSVNELVWQDGRLSWDKLLHGGITSILLDSANMWIPELIVDNRVDQISVLMNPDFLVRVRDNGTVSWDLPAVIITHCEVDITMYPRDQQNCDIELTSWAYNVDEIMLSSFADDIDITSLRKSGEWDIVKTGHLVENMTECCPADVYPQLRFFMTLQRKTSYYVLNILLPVVLLSFLSVVVFLLPMDSGEKMSYSVTVLLAYAVFLSIITSSMPTTSNHLSILALYLAITLVIGTLTVVFTVFVSVMYSKEPTEIPSKGMQKFVGNFIVKVICYQRKPNKISTGTPRQYSAKRNKNTPNNKDDIRISELDNTSDTQPRFHEEFPVYTWREIAVIFDMFFFWLFLLITFLLALVFLGIIFM